MGCNLCTQLETDHSSVSRSASPHKPIRYRKHRISSFCGVAQPSPNPNECDPYASGSDYSEEEAMDEVPVSKLNLQ